MTILELGAIGELMGGIAIIISLIYVGKQIKHSARAAEIAAAQSYAEVDNGVVGVINLSNELADVLHRGAKGLSELEGGDVIRFMAFQDQLFKTYLAGYVQWKGKTLDDRLWNTIKHSLVSLLQQPGQQEWWELRRHWYDSEFQEYVDRNVEQTPGKAMHPRSFNG
jgi:hypothetical protein